MIHDSFHYYDWQKLRWRPRPMNHQRWKRNASKLCQWFSLQSLLQQLRRSYAYFLTKRSTCDELVDKIGTKTKFPFNLLSIIVMFPVNRFNVHSLICENHCSLFSTIGRHEIWDFDIGFISRRRRRRRGGKSSWINFKKHFAVHIQPHFVNSINHSQK